MPGPPNPLAQAYPSTRPTSKHTHTIGGIICEVYGLDDLPSDVTTVSCLWLLHPRLSKKELMEPIAHLCISAWNDKLAHVRGAARQGLIAVAFDQRNHGTRLVDKLANQAWLQGNPRHAQDMFSVFQGTALDCSQLISYLSAYVFPGDERSLTAQYVLGVSLGAHAAWHVVMHDERVSTAVIMVGCADYRRLMEQRAEASKLESWVKSNPPGASFVGSSGYPSALAQAVDKFDPAASLMGEMAETSSNTMKEPSEKEKIRLTPLMRDKLAGKRILNQAGGKDNLVPYSCSEPFMKWLKKAISPSGWFAGHDIHLTDKVYADEGHAFSVEMAADATYFITNLLDSSGSPSKI